jgi:pilus assembly protein Flp/PilA
MKKFWKDESGATSIEYALIAGAMGLALITVMPTLSGAVEAKYSSLATALTNPA